MRQYRECRDHRGYHMRFAPPGTAHACPQARAGAASQYYQNQGDPFSSSPLSQGQQGYGGHQQSTPPQGQQGYGGSQYPQGPSQGTRGLSGGDEYSVSRSNTMPVLMGQQQWDDPQAQIARSYTFEPTGMVTGSWPSPPPSSSPPHMNGGYGPPRHKCPRCDESLNE